VTYQSTILAEASLQSYWQLNEPAGTSGAGSVIDSDATAPHHGTPTSVTFGATPILADGTTSASFPGAACGISMGNVYPFNGTAAYSVEAWVNLPNMLYGTMSIIGQWINTDGYVLMIDSAGHARAQRWVASATTDAIGSTVLSNDTTYHLVYTYDGTNSRIYVNAGTPVVGASDTRTLATTANFGIGAYNGGTFYYTNGRIGHGAVYNAALSAGQITQHYNDGLTVFAVGNIPTPSSRGGH
jgi:hypothetical protein